MSNIYIPNHLKKLKIISDFYNMLTTYETENPLRTSDDFLVGDIDEVVKVNQGDPVYYFTWCVLRDKVLSEGYNNEYLHNIVTYITKLFYCVKGTMKVFDFMEKYLNLEFAESAKFENGNTLVFKLGKVSGFSSEFSVNFDNALRKFLSRLIYSSSFCHSYESIELTIGGDLKQTISSNVKVYRIFNVVLSDSDNKIIEIEEESVKLSELYRYYLLGGVGRTGIKSYATPNVLEIQSDVDSAIDLKVNIIWLKGIWISNLMKPYVGIRNKIVLERVGQENADTLKELYYQSGGTNTGFPGMEAVKVVDFSKKLEEYSNNDGFEISTALGKINEDEYYTGFRLYVNLSSDDKAKISDYSSWSSFCNEFEKSYIDELEVVVDYKQDTNVYNIIFTDNIISKASITGNNPISIKSGDIVFYGSIEGDYIGSDKNLYGWGVNIEDVYSTDLNEVLYNPEEIFKLSNNSNSFYQVKEDKNIYIGFNCQNSLAVQNSSLNWSTYLFFNYSNAFNSFELGENTIYEIGNKEERQFEINSLSSENSIKSININDNSLSAEDLEEMETLGLQFYINQDGVDTIIDLATTSSIEINIETALSYGFKANVVSIKELEYLTGLYKVLPSTGESLDSYLEEGELTLNISKNG